MYPTNQTKPGRQTMLNIKPMDHVPYEHAVQASILQVGRIPNSLHANPYSIANNTSDLAVMS